MKYIGLFLIAPLLSIVLTASITKKTTSEKMLRVIALLIFMCIIGFGFIILSR